MLSAVSNAGSSDGGTSVAAMLAKIDGNKDPTAVTSVIKEALVGKMADMLRIPTEEIDVGRPISHYGVESLVALEVRNWIKKELKANIALLEILATMPIEQFADKTASKSELVKGLE